MLLFSSHNPFTIAGLNRNHRRKSLPSLSLWNAGQKPRGNTNGTRNLISLTPCSSGLGVFSYFPFKTFQALAEGGEAHRHTGDSAKYWQTDLKGSEMCFGIMNSDLFGFIRCTVVFRRESKPKKKLICKKPIAKQLLLGEKKIPPCMKTATETPTKAKYLSILCLRVHLIHAIWKWAQHTIKST